MVHGGEIGSDARRHRRPQWRLASHGVAGHQWRPRLRRDRAARPGHPRRDELPAEHGRPHASPRGDPASSASSSTSTPDTLFQDPLLLVAAPGHQRRPRPSSAIGMMLWLGNRSKEETLERILSMSLLDGVIVTAHFLDDPLVDGLSGSALPTVLVGHRRAGPDRELRRHRQPPMLPSTVTTPSHQARPAADRSRHRCPRDRRGRGPHRRLPTGDGAGRPARRTG